MLALVVRVRVEAKSWSTAVLEMAPSEAVRVAAPAVRLVQFTLAVKLAVVAPAATGTVAGTVTAVLLLPRKTLVPPVAAETLTITVQTSVVEPMTEALAQVIAVTSGTPVPVRLIAVLVPAELLSLLGMVNAPVTAPATAGSNVRVKTVVCPGFRVTGKVVPVNAKPAPDIVGALMVRGRLPVELKVTVFVTAVVTPSLPNAKLVALVVRVRVAAKSWSATVLEMPPSEAVRVAVPAVRLDQFTVAVKLADAAPAATETVAGTVTAVLLLARVTVEPPVAAATLTVTVQTSVVEPVTDKFAQVTPVILGIPVPVRVIAVLVPAELLLLLEMVNAPVTAPAAVGSNLTVKAVVCPGFNVTGKVVPVTVNPAPVIVGALMVRGRFPVELKVSVFVTAVVTPSLPNAKVVAEVVRVRVAAKSWSATDLPMPPSMPVRVAVEAVRLVEFTVAVKLAVVAPAATVTVAGTVTAVLLLSKVTAEPPVAAATLTVTVQTSVVEPVTDKFAQVTPVILGIPVPVRLIAVLVPAELLLLLEMVNAPVTAPATAGSNVRVKTVVCPGFRVTGKVVPVNAKPAPDIVGALMVRGRLPVELKVKVLV